MDQKQEWVDFKKVKAAVDMQMVLDHYGIKGLARHGDELRGPCPIHKGSSRSKTFTVNVKKNAFNCFSSDCKARGNILDFVAAMECCQIVDAAIKLSDWFSVGRGGAASVTNSREAQIEVSLGIYTDPNGALFEVIANATAEDLEKLVVYRELFGDYRCWAVARENFDRSTSRFTLVKSV
jgi:hypothetical protein